MANRAVVWNFGSSNVVDGKGSGGTELVLRKKPRASPGHVVVRMTTRPVYLEDLRESLLIPDQTRKCGEKVVIGMEGCGVVEEIGEGVSEVQIKVGMRVIPFLLSYLCQEPEGEGSWQDYVEVAEEDLLVVPDTIPTEVAAQLLNCWTAYALLKDLNLPKGEYLLQTAAGSTIARLVIRLARIWGLKTINIVRRNELVEELKELGADAVFNSTNEDLVARVKNITGGRGAYVGIDYVGGSISKTVASCVRDGGQSLAIGCLESTEFTVSFSDLKRGVQLKGWDVVRHFHRSEERDKEALEVLKLFIDNIFQVRPIWKMFPLENYEEAILEVQKDNGKHGKVLLIS